MDWSHEQEPIKVRGNVVASYGSECIPTLLHTVSLARDASEAVHRSCKCKCAIIRDVDKVL